MSNSAITANVEAAEIAKINDVLARIAKTGKKAKGIAKQAAIFAIQSAAKATKPGSGSNVSRLPKKYKFRPAEKMPETGYFWYKWMPKGGGNPRFFKKEHKIKTRKDGSLKRLTRGIKYWSGKHGKFEYLPYDGKGKYDTSDKRFRIPHAGWAKIGWLKALRLFGKKADLGPGEKKTRETTIVRKRETNDEISIEITNNVSYIMKTSPQSAAIGLRKARKRVESIYLRKLEKDMRREANR